MSQRETPPQRRAIDPLRASWLPLPPTDLRQQLASAAGTAPAGAALQGLANHDLDLVGLRTVGRTLARLRAEGVDRSPLEALSLSILSNASTDYLGDVIAATALRYGFDAIVRTFPFGQVAQQALDPTSEFQRGDASLVLLAMDHRGLPLVEDVSDPARAAAGVAEAKAQLQALVGALRRDGRTVILQTLPASRHRLFGSLDVRQDGTLQRQVTEINRFVVDELAGPGDLVLDVAGLADRIGLVRWHDDRAWQMAKLPFSIDCVPAYAEALCRLAAAHRGRTRKCLVLDLDNTAWGGEIGDVGVEGIVLGQGSGEGEAFLSIQAASRRLKDRGVILAVCSKNDEDTARAAFRDHPDMLLREADIASFVVNWGEKADNLLAIADELGVLPSALVFLDDNPLERIRVRAALPDVAVPEFPEDPSFVPAILEAAGYFEAARFSNEDRQRGTYYRQEAERKSLRRKLGDADTYLAALQMEMTVGAVSPQTRARMAQLINKTNQFNLTGRRTSEGELAEIEADPHRLALWARLRDSFGDSGLIAALVCRRQATDWHIDTFVMSCRILGRGVEQTLLSVLANHAQAAGARRLRGRFVPTKRNHPAADAYARLGFTRAGGNDGDQVWELDLSAPAPSPGPVAISLDSLCP